MNKELSNQLAAMATAARPVDQDEWGSERNNRAFNVFTEEASNKMDIDQDEAWQGYSNKACVDEIIDEGLRILGWGIEDLSTELNLWLILHGLPANSADEVRDESGLSETEKDYLDTFIHRWDAAVGNQTSKDRTIIRIAKSFSHLLLEEIGRGNLLTVIKKNFAEISPLVCHSHDFCDANMIMDQAFNADGIDPLGADDGCMTDEIVAIWNAAWDMAKAEKFFNAHLIKGEKT